MHGAVEGALDVGEIGGDVVAPEELMRQRAPADEDLVGKLATQHPPIGHTLAGALFGQPIEGSHTDRREREQVAVVTAVDDERVAEFTPASANAAIGSSTDDVPGQADRRR